MDEERFSRNIALFDEGGQKKIADSHVGLVGLGGLGSHVAQQLTYLGVGELTFVDGDIVTLSSMNRVVGATQADVNRLMKVFVAQRTTEQVITTTAVHAIPEWLDCKKAREALECCDYIFSCLDSDPARVNLTELCARHRIPFFDLATDTGRDSEGVWYGGRVLFSGLGDRCASCMSLLDQSAMTRESMDEQQREVDARIYGVDAGSLGETGPAVVALNGVVASLAVMEWMVFVTGLRAPRPLLHYRGRLGVVTASIDEPEPGCYYCGLWGDQSRESEIT